MLVVVEASAEVIEEINSSSFVPRVFNCPLYHLTSTDL